MKTILTIIVLLTATIANAQPGRSVQRERSAQINRGRFSGQLPAQPLRVPARVPAANTTPVPVPTPTPRPPRPAPNVIIRPRPIIINPGVRAPVRSGIRYRTVIRNGVPVQVPYYADGVVQQSITQYNVPSTSSVRQYSSSSLIEQLQAENAALREENAFLKGQVQALQESK